MTSPAAEDKMVIYRMDLSEPLPDLPLSKGAFVLVAGAEDTLVNFFTGVKNWGWAETLKTSLKVLSRRRQFFGVLLDDKVIQSGWANLGFCRHYPVERDSVVLGALWTAPEHRGQGLATAAMRRMMAHLFRQGYRRFYVDAWVSNQASQRMIRKAGFLSPRA